MSRDYQPHKNNPYILPRSLYLMTLAFIRGNPTEHLGLRRMELSIAISAVEDALQSIPEEYRKGVYANIVLYQRYPDDAEPRTYRRYKAKFIYKVAKNMFWT